MAALQPLLPAAQAFPAFPHARPPSLAAGQDSRVVENSLTAIAKVPPSASGREMTAKDALSERLFNVSAQLKILVSQVSMHLPDEWRRRLFRKIDGLHDPEDWEDTDRPVALDSFTNFLRLALQTGPITGMSIGVSPEGHFLVGWIDGRDSLSLEFVGSDEVRWAVVRYIGEQRESAVGRTNRERLPHILKPFTLPNWFENAVAISS